MRPGAKLAVVLALLLPSGLLFSQDSVPKRAAIHSPVVDAVKRASPAVVNISTEKIVTMRTPDPMKLLFDDENFNRYFERYQQRNVR